MNAQNLIVSKLSKVYVWNNDNQQIEQICNGRNEVMNI